MDTDSNDIKALQTEVKLLKEKLGKVKGYLEFIESEDDPSHTLRSPLVSMKSFLGVLEMSRDNLTEEEMKDFLNGVNSSVDKLLQIVDSFFKE